MLDTKKKDATVAVKINSTDKDQAIKLFDSLGLNLSTAINIFIKKSISEGGLPFSVKDPFYSKANQAELDRRFAKINSKQDVHAHNLLDD